MGQCVKVRLGIEMGVGEEGGRRDLAVSVQVMGNMAEKES